jgi:ubiquinone/menaquinone biosynthesis C-methylase UbiE
MADASAVKQRQQQTWAAGDYAKVGASFVIVSELLCEAVELRAGQKVLDVATGTGNTALAAARRFCDVVGIDFVPTWLERARARAAVEGLSITFREGDVEDIPCPDASFDVVLSTFGAMFAPNQEQAAKELLRVCQSGGRIGMANWTPEGGVAEMFRIMARYLPPPPPDFKPPNLWGTEARLHELFGDRVASLHVAKRTFLFRHHSARHFVEFSRAYSGPYIAAFQTINAQAHETVAREMEEVVSHFNQSGDASLLLPSYYLEVVATKR